MQASMVSPSRRNNLICLFAALALLLLAVGSLFVGRYPLTLNGLLADAAQQRRVFMTLRLPRMLTGVIGGFGLGVCGYVYQTVFRNPLASPDIIGVASGASAGAAAGILFFSGAAAITACSFAGALMAVAAALALSMMDRSGKGGSIVLAGIAVHALAQTVLMALKLTADPERELASIEYWIMGILSGISLKSITVQLPLCLVCVAALFVLQRQLLLLSADEDEARMLGVRVGAMRFAVLTTATLAVASVVSLTGLISFVGLLAPHAARMLVRQNRRGTMLLSGVMGGILLCGADIPARSAAASELPVSIFTSLIGAPFLLVLLFRGRRSV